VAESVAVAANYFAVENTVVGSVEKAVGAAESYSETQNYLVDENLKGDLYYLETQNYLAYIDYSIHFEASSGFGRRKASPHY
jgi:hypothetical protein